MQLATRLQRLIQWRLDVFKILNGDYMTVLVLMMLLSLEWKNPDVDILAYTFALNLSDNSDRVAGRAQIELEIKTAGLTSFALNLVGPSKERTGMTVSRVHSRERDLEFVQHNELLRVQLPQPADPSGKYHLEVIYSGVPADGLVISENRFSQRTFFADNWPNRARYWLPCVDHPSDKAICTFVVEAPAHYQVVANGKLTELTDLPLARRRSRWQTNVPIPTKVMVIGVARFAVQQLATLEAVPLSSWVFPQERERGLPAFAGAAPVLTWMSEYIGPFPYQKLANVQSSTRYGGMENAGAIFYSERVFERDIELLLAHEIAHQWFGDSVSEADWPHIWLSEGFATYFSWRYLETVHGPTRLQQSLMEARAAILDYHEKWPEKAVVRKEDDLKNYLGAYNYRKGAWLLHMLCGLLGENLFQEGIRLYYETYRHGNAETQDFQAIMEKVSKRELGWFFRQWLWRPDLPQLQVSWRFEKGQLHVTVSQQGKPFRLMLPLVFEKGNSKDSQTLQLQARTTHQTFAMPSAPDRLLVNPASRLLLGQMQGEGKGSEPRK